MSHDAIGIGIAWFQLIFGFVYLVWGLRTKESPGTRYFAPVGLWWILAASFHFLNGNVPDSPLIALAVVSFAAVGVWAFRMHQGIQGGDPRNHQAT